MSIHREEEEEEATNQQPAEKNNKQQEEEHETDISNISNEKVLKILDSVDSYLTLFDDLSSILRQGWLELASARHSMGATRISSTLFDLNCHSAATSLKVNFDDSPTGMNQPEFSLCKWGSCNKEISPEDENFDEDKTMSSQLRQRGSSVIQEKDHKSNGSTHTVDDQIQKERSKSLSMFGTLVSPKLRSSQLTFESALETLVEIANMRSAILSAYNEVEKEVTLP